MAALAAIEPLATLEGRGVCRINVGEAVGDLSKWADELSKVTPLSVFAEDGDYAQYRNILDDDTMGGFPFGEVLKAITPCLTRNFVDRVSDLRLDDAFAIHYNEDHYDTKVGRHTDPSDVTVNLCLYRSADLEGSEVLFHGVQKLKDTNVGEEGSADPLIPSVASGVTGLQFRVGAQSGWATIHWGKHPHQVTMLRKGQRTNVVMTYVFKDPALSSAQCAGCYCTDADEGGK
jgi:hypothetical protein